MTAVEWMSLRFSGVTDYSRGDVAAAEQYFEQALASARAAGEPAAEAASVNMLAVLACDRREYTASQPLAEEAVGLARAGGDGWTEAWSLGWLGRREHSSPRATITHIWRGADRFRAALRVRQWRRRSRVRSRRGVAGVTLGGGFGWLDRALRFDLRESARSERAQSPQSGRLPGRSDHRPPPSATRPCWSRSPCSS